MKDLTTILALTPILALNRGICKMKDLTPILALNRGICKMKDLTPFLPFSLLLNLFVHLIKDIYLAHPPCTKTVP